jgi:hypothetical protein
MFDHLPAAGSEDASFLGRRLVHSETGASPLFIHSPGGFNDCHEELFSKLGSGAGQSKKKNSPAGTSRRIKNTNCGDNSDLFGVPSTQPSTLPSDQPSPLAPTSAFTQFSISVSCHLSGIPGLLDPGPLAHLENFSRDFLQDDIKHGLDSVELTSHSFVTAPTRRLQKLDAGQILKLTFTFEGFLIGLAPCQVTDLLVTGVDSVAFTSQLRGSGDAFFAAALASSVAEAASAPTEFVTLAPTAEPLFSEFDCQGHAVLAGSAIMFADTTISGGDVNKGTAIDGTSHW